MGTFKLKVMVLNSQIKLLEDVLRKMFAKEVEENGVSFIDPEELDILKRLEEISDSFKDVLEEEVKEIDEINKRISIMEHQNERIMKELESRA